MGKSDSVKPPPAPLQLWGGVECNVVRVGDVCRDQVRETGHYDRPEDLDRAPALGLRTLCYSVLREHCAAGDIVALAQPGWWRRDDRLHVSAC